MMLVLVLVMVLTWVVVAVDVIVTVVGRFVVVFVLHVVVFVVGRFVVVFVLHVVVVVVGRFVVVFVITAVVVVTGGHVEDPIVVTGSAVGIVGIRKAPVSSSIAKVRSVHRIRFEFTSVLPFLVRSALTNASAVMASHVRHSC